MDDDGAVVGGGLVCKEKNKEASQNFKFFCSCTHPTQLLEVYPIPLWTMMVQWLEEV